MSRQKTNSITHLVKIVAQEIWDQNTPRTEQVITYNIDAKDLIDNLVNNLRKAGASWSLGEEDLLRKEMDVALKTLAVNHQRTVGAIVARIKFLGIYEGITEGWGGKDE